MAHQELKDSIVCFLVTVSVYPDNKMIIISIVSTELNCFYSTLVIRYRNENAPRNWSGELSQLICWYLHVLVFLVFITQ